MNGQAETLHFWDYWRVVWSRKEVVIAVALVIVVTGSLVTYLVLPKVYMASARIEIKQEIPAVDVFRPQIIPSYNPYFIRTQFEILQSRPILEEVISQLGLEEKLGKAYGFYASPNRAQKTLRFLGRSMKVQQYRDTDLIEIQIYLSRPEEGAPQLAADIANKVADVFREKQMETSRREKEAGLKAVYEEYQQSEKNVADAEKRLEQIRREQGISVVGPRGRGDTLEIINLPEWNRNILMGRAELADRKARMDKINNVPPEQLADAIRFIIGDATLEILLRQRMEAEVRLKERLTSYAQNHPEVQSVQAMIDELKKKIQDTVSGLRIGIQADYEAQKAKLDTMELELAAAKEREIVGEGARMLPFTKAEQDVERLKKIRDSLHMRWIEEDVEINIPKTLVRMWEPAVPPTEPVSPKPMLNIILSIIIGIGSGIGIAFFWEYLDTSLKTVEDIEQYIGSPVLGVVPQKVRPLPEEDPESPHAEAYRVIRTNIQFSKKRAGGKTFCVTSGSVGEGKSLTLLNLAYVCSQLGDKVLIVDSDLRRPRQHKMLGISNRFGLANVLIGEASVADVVKSTNCPNLWIMASGKLTAPSHGLLDTERMRDLIQELKTTYDYVFFDSPPIMGVSDASVLVREVDCVLLVIQHRKYPRSVSVRAKSMIESVGGNLLGVILNNINVAKDYYYYYYHSYAYQYSQPEKRGADHAGAGRLEKPGRVQESAV